MRIILILVALASIVHAQRPKGVIENYRPHYLGEIAGAPKDGSIKATFLGTSTILFDDGDTQLLVDGFLSRPSMFKVGTGPIETDTKLVDAVLKRIGADRVKAIFVVHSHYDHSFDTAYIAKVTKAKLHGSASTLNIGRGGGLPEDQLVLFEGGKQYTVGKFTVTVIASKHTKPIKGINDDLGKTIDKPLKQPARFSDYVEGGSYDFLIAHGTHSILVKPSAAVVEGALDNVHADVLFLGTATFGHESDEYRDLVYRQSVSKVKPSLLIPVHWDTFFNPLSDKLDGAPDDIPKAFDFLIDRCGKDKIRFGILQGFQSTLLFENAKK